MTVSPNHMLVSLDIDDERYKAVGREFMLGVVSAVARGLGLPEDTTVDLPKPSIDDLNRLFTASFSLAARLEDQGGFLVEGDRYFTHVFFAKSPHAPDNLLGSWQRVALHGQLENDLLIEALRKR